METAALLNKVNDFARENNCRCTVVVFEKGHEEYLSARLFRMFTENGAQIIKVPTSGKEHAPKLNATKDVMQSGKVKKTVAIKSGKSVSAPKAKESKKALAKKANPVKCKTKAWKQNAADLLSILRSRLADLQAAE